MEFRQKYLRHAHERIVVDANDTFNNTLLYRRRAMATSFVPEGNRVTDRKNGQSLNETNEIKKKRKKNASGTHTGREKRLNGVVKRLGRVSRTTAAVRLAPRPANFTYNTDRCRSVAEISK